MDNTLPCVSAAFAVRFIYGSAVVTLYLTLGMLLMPFGDVGLGGRGLAGACLRSRAAEAQPCG